MGADAQGLILMLHSWARWLLVIVAIVALVKFGLGWAQRAGPDAMGRGLMAGFSGLVDLQAALGVIFFLWSGLGGAGFPGYRIEHAIAMLIAVVIAHLPMRWRKRADPTVARNNFLVIAAVLVIVFVGVVALPGGLARWGVS